MGFFDRFLGSNTITVNNNQAPDWSIGSFPAAPTGLTGVGGTPVPVPKFSQNPTKVNPSSPGLTTGLVGQNGQPVAVPSFAPAPTRQQLEPTVQIPKPEPVYASVSMYNPYDARQTKKNPDGIMASGKKAYAGAVATNDRDIPFGTKVIINGKEYTVEDHMNERFNYVGAHSAKPGTDPLAQGRIFDIVNMGDEASSWQFGRQKLEYTLKNYPEKATMLSKDGNWVSLDGTLDFGGIEGDAAGASESFNPRSSQGATINPLKLAAAIPQGLARFGASAALTALGGNNELAIDETASDVEKTIQRFLFSDESVKDFATRIAEAEQTINTGAFGISGGKASLPLAIGAVAGGEALNFITGGASAEVKALVKAGTTKEAAAILNGMGFAEDVVAYYAPRLAQAKSKAAVEAIYKPLVNALRPVKEGVTRIQFLSPNVEKDLTWTQVKKNLKSPEYAAKYDEVNARYLQGGVKGDLLQGAGDWADGSEQTFIKHITSDMSDEEAIYNLAVQGKALRQTDVIDFKLLAGGPDELFMLDPGKHTVDKMRDILNKAGVTFKTLQDNRTYIVNKAGDYFDAGMVDKLKKLEQTSGIMVDRHSGVATFVTGAEDREAAQAIYDEVINKFKSNARQSTNGVKEGAVLGKSVSKEAGGARTAVGEGKGFTPKPSVERGFITSVKEQFPAMKVAGQHIIRDTDELAIKARNLVAARPKIAEEMALNGLDDISVAVSAELIKKYNRLASEAVDVATQEALYLKAAEFATTTARNLTQHGRAVQAAAILSRLTPEGQMRFAASEIARYNQKIEKSYLGKMGLAKKIPELTAAQARKIADEMKEINAMADGEAKAIRFHKFQEMMSKLLPTALHKKVTAIFKAGLLTGIRTTGVNIFSNLANSVLEPTSRIPASLVDSVSSFLSGQRTLMGPSFKETKQTFKGVMEGFQKGWRYFRTGFDERGMGIKLDHVKVHFGDGIIGRTLQKYEDTVFRLMGAEDQPFYYGNKAASIANQAIARGKNIGYKGNQLETFVNKLIRNPEDDMLRYAVLDAETAVYQNSTALGAAGNKIQEIPVLGQILLPFNKTPSAFITQVINYTPAGFGKPVMRLFGLAKSGVFDQRLFSQEMGRALTGTGIIALGMTLAAKGLISGDRPKDEREIELQRLEGRTPNSIKIGGRWMSPQVLGPAGNLLLIGGHFQRALESNGSPTGAIATALAGSAKSLSEQTFLKGMNSAIDAINDPARYGEGYFGSLLASTVPTIVGDVAKATDKVERTPQTILERIQARLPGLRGMVQPNIDVFGQEEKTSGGFLQVMADPTRSTKDISTPLISELRRLANAGIKVSPTKLGEKQGYKSLTPEQNTDLWKRAGTIVKGKLESLVAHPEYRSLSDEEKGKTINRFVEQAKIVARAEKVLEETQGLTGTPLLNTLKLLKASGLMTDEVYKKYIELR